MAQPPSLEPDVPAGAPPGADAAGAQDRREQAARESEATIAKAFYLFPDPYFLAEQASGRLIDVNDAYCRLFGVKREEAIRQSSDEESWADPEERRRFRELLGRDGEVREMEQSRLNRSGEPLACLATAFRVEIGGRDCVLCRIRDITRERQAEAALSESQEKFVKAFYASIDAIAIGEFPSGRITEVNDAFCRLFDYERSAIIGRNGAELGLWGDMKDRDRFVEALNRYGVVEEMEVKKLRRRGEHLVCRITSHRLVVGQRVSMVTRIRDITGQRMAEVALLESEEKFSKAFKAAPDAIAISTLAEGRYIDVNDSFLRDYGWKREEVIGQTSSELGIWADLGDRRRLVEALNAGRQVRDWPVVFRSKSGRLLRTLYSAEVIEIAGSLRLLSIVRDITEQQHLEEQLRQAQKMESLGLLAGGVAHDFNNILTVIQGNVGLVLDDGRLPSEAVPMLRQVQQGAEFAASLTRQLLVFSRRQMLQPDRVDLGEIVQRMADLLRRTIGEDIAMRVAVERGLPAAHADLGMVEQVLLNLAVNARDAMPRGGELLISTAALQTDQAYLARMPQAKAGHFVGLRVRDNGVGIPHDVRPHIFDPFFTTKGEGKGSGLGLAMVYGIAQQHGGWIEVDSEPGRGSEFTVWFPALPNEPALPPAAARPAAARGHETVLLVEDKDAVREMLKLLFVRKGYRPLVASNGEEALALWAGHRDEIRLLFTDVIMPGGVNGRELAERLRVERPELRVIYCSGYDAQILGAEALAVPGTRFLAKPFDVAQAMVLVREVLEQPAAS